MIGLLRYGAGNVGSVARALRRLAIPVRLVESPEDLSQVSGLIFPGAGAAPAAKRDLHARGLAAPLRRYRRPFLGLCLGMQLLLEASEEGRTECLGVVRGQVRELPPTVVRPHIGWNQLDTGAYVYFVHSYQCCPADPGVVTMTTWYGGTLCAGLRQRNFFGVQWHPEKSGAAGDRLLTGFARLCE